MGLFGFGKKKKHVEEDEDVEITFDNTDEVNKISCNFYHGAFNEGKLLAGTKTTIQYDENLPVEEVQGLLSENNSDGVVRQYDEYTKKELSKIIGSAVDKLDIRRTNELEFKNRYECDYAKKAEDKFEDGYSEFYCADSEFLKNLFGNKAEEVEACEDKVDENTEENTSEDSAETETAEETNAEAATETAEEVDVTIQEDEDTEGTSECVDNVIYEAPEEHPVEDDTTSNVDCVFEEVSETQEETSQDDSTEVAEDVVISEEELELPYQPQTTDDYTIEQELEECGVACDAVNDLESNVKEDCELESITVDEIVQEYDFGIEPINCDYNKIPVLDNAEDQGDKKEVSIMSNDYVDVNEKIKNLLSRNDLCVDSQNVLEIMPDLIKLQNDKANLYGRSWCKHGEISAFFNIERKWDRFQNIMEKCLDNGVNNTIYDSEENTDVFIDTVLDLTAYTSMLLGYIKENHPDEYKRFMENVSTK